MPVVTTSAYSTAGDCFELVRAMLNDADIPNVFVLPIVTQTNIPGVSRTMNVVTVSLDVVHGLQIGNIVQLGYVNDTSFNGTFQVTTVPNATAFTFSQPGPDANSGNGTVSLIIQGDIYQDAVLVPFCNKAIRKVSAQLLMNGSPTSIADTILQLPAGLNSLYDGSSPQLPADFLAPRTLKQRITGQVGWSCEIAPVDQLPDQPVQPNCALNSCYAWFDDGIQFPGATNELDLWLRYFKGPLPISNADSVITIRFALDVVADYTAYLAANSRGSASAAMFLSTFNEDMAEFLTMQAHARQYHPTRRRAYNAYARSGGRWLGTTV